MKRLYIYALTTLAATWALSSCKKFLDAKSDASLSTPSTLEDLQAILNNSKMNAASDLKNTLTDEYYVKYNDWVSFGGANIRLGYVWDKEIEDPDDWGTKYNAIFYANTVLDHLDKIKAGGQLEEWNAIKGAALFFRAFHFFEAAQLFASQYDVSTADTDLGIPLRLTSDFNLPTTRSTIRQTYNQILSDLEEAAALLPLESAFKVRPCKPAAYAMLARVYLQTGNYEKAKENADSCLNLYNSLIDYNQLPDILNPFEVFHPEVIFYMSSLNALTCYDFWAIVDSTLYKSYADNDLRKSLFFEDIYGDGSFRYEVVHVYTIFNGLAVDEMYLTRAECHARAGNLSAAMNDLNTLLIKRWKAGTFVPFSANNADEALGMILQERRKQLLNRGTRWGDLRRLNKEPRFAMTLKRVLNGKVYELPPNDPRYTLLIPREIIAMTGIQQNHR